MLEEEEEEEEGAGGKKLPIISCPKHEAIET
jgi:hypothetical protein